MATVSPYREDPPATRHFILSCRLGQPASSSCQLLTSRAYLYSAAAARIILLISPPIWFPRSVILPPLVADIRKQTCSVISILTEKI